MKSSTRLRLGAVVAAAAVVAGGLFAAAPANAATGTITLANTTYTAGSWGAGIDVTGTGFTPSASVTVLVVDSSPATLDTHVVSVATDSNGAFHEIYTPSATLDLPAQGIQVGVTAVSDKGDTSNVEPLTVLAPKAIRASVSTITTADLANEKVGFDLYAAGYTPSETLTFTASFDGVKFDTFTETAFADGSIDEHLWMTGVVESGRLTIAVSGATSGLSQSVDIQVTGDPVVTDDQSRPSIGATSAAATTTAPAQPSRLPVVSG